MELRHSCPVINRSGSYSTANCVLNNVTFFVFYKMIYFIPCCTVGYRLKSLTNQRRLKVHLASERRVLEGSPASRTRVSFGVRLSREYSRLTQMESLLAGSYLVEKIHFKVQIWFTSLLDRISLQCSLTFNCIFTLTLNSRLIFCRELAHFQIHTRQCKLTFESWLIFQCRLTRTRKDRVE